MKFKDYVTCHGCNGRGIVENQYGSFVICPLCRGKGIIHISKIMPDEEK